MALVFGGDCKAVGMSVTSSNTLAQQAWLACGYELFAMYGPSALKIEPMAARVGISKSSFYHHFADLEGFQSQLFAMHIGRAVLIANKERAAHCIDPDLVNILLEHRLDLFFSRQLRIHRDLPGFESTMLKADAALGNDFIGIWKRELGLSWNTQQLESVFSLALEHFYLQLQPDRLNADWLREHFALLKQHLLVLHGR